MIIHGESAASACQAESALLCDVGSEVEKTSGRKLFMAVYSQVPIYPLH